MEAMIIRDPTVEALIERKLALEDTPWRAEYAFVLRMIEGLRRQEGMNEYIEDLDPFGWGRFPAPVGRWAPLNP